jgi:hypothetical protein
MLQTIVNWQLCEGSTECMRDCYISNGFCTWQAAKKHFQDKGYFGDYILYRQDWTHGTGKIWNIHIKKKDKQKGGGKRD